ncbi:MAG: RDD family protein [Acidobacteria bacterium]|nr:RDD family protein [Acidobacteriota bacterium]
MPPSEVPETTPRRPSTAADFPRSGPFSLAAPGPRFAARAVDLLVVGFPALLIIVVTTAVRNAQLEFDLPLWLGPSVFVLGSLYEFLGVVTTGRTPGKWLFGLRVVRMLDGRRPTAVQALLRGMVPWMFVALPLGMLSVPVVLLVYGTAIAGELHRGVADQAGGTVVISTR